MSIAEQFAKKILEESSAKFVSRKEYEELEWKHLDMLRRVNNLQNQWQTFFGRIFWILLGDGMDFQYLGKRRDDV